MPRANPSRSPYCTVRHLLRHLYDGKALLRNPLVRVHYAGRDPSVAARSAQVIFSDTLAAMDAEHGADGDRNKRYAAILIRYDALRHSRSAIARDFGISLREFERERSTAMSRFIRSAYARNPARPAIEVRDNLADLTRTHATRIADAGDLKTATVLLEDVAKTAGSNLSRFDSLVDLAFAHSMELEVIRADAYLKDAVILLDTLTGEDAPDAAASLSAARFHLALLTHGPRVNEWRQQHQTHPQFYLTRAAADLMSGSSASASKNVSLATRLLERSPNPQPSWLVMSKLFQAQIQFWRDSDDKKLIQQSKAAGDLARTNGLHGHALVAEHLVDIAQWALKSDEGARSRARSLGERIGRVKLLPKVYQCDIYTGLADAELAIGDPWRAVHWANSAAELVVSTFDRALLKGFSCRGFAIGGRLDRAAVLAEEIISESPSSSSTRASLNARLTLSDIAYSRGRLSAAFENLREAARLAEQCASGAQLSRINRRLVALTKRR